MPFAYRSLWLAAGLLSFAGTAHAQYFDGPAYAFPVTDMMGPAMAGTSMNSYIKGRKTQPRAERPRPAPQRLAPAQRQDGALTDLRIGSDPAISAAVNTSFRDQLIRANPTHRAAIEQALSRDWLAGYRDEIARPNGLDARNLADAVTAYSIAAWAIVHKQATISPRSIAAVRDTMRETMAASPQAAGLGPAGRQRMAEALIHQTVLIMANRTEIARRRDSAMADAASQHYRNAALSGMKVDLSTVQLTDQGFTPR